MNETKHGPAIWEYVVECSGRRWIVRDPVNDRCECGCIPFVVRKFRASAPALSTEPTADKARRSQNRVHNHGPEEGKGLGCKETLVDGKLRGECLDWYGDQGS